jgi:hypothetical protein
MRNVEQHFEHVALQYEVGGGCAAIMMMMMMMMGGEDQPDTCWATR